MSTWRARLKRVLPFVSLGTGVASALWMNRSPQRVWIVVVASLAVWVFLFMLSRTLARPEAEVSSTRARAGRFALLLFSQVLTQQALLFPLPFYLRAAQAHPRHAVFFAAYAAAIVCALWDPLYERIARRPLLALGLSAFAAFVGLAMVLPVLGLSNTTALVLAAGGAALALPMLSLLSGARSPKRIAMTLAGMVTFVLLARGLAFLVPPAPLELARIDIGTGIVDRELTGNTPGDDDVLQPQPALFCHTAVKAPLGLKDALVHVWRKDGARLTVVPLDVKGGRDAGFRTWSRLAASPVLKPGRYACEVQTASGQLLGRSRVIVRASGT
jgi:Family of unknown function (DUF5924)/Protein of unknown function (DUF2914)